MSDALDSTTRFSGRADDYARYRPSYPAGAIDAIFEGLGDPARLTVVDIGAGTGISTRLLAERGATVTGIEPNAAMREHANDLDVREGTASATGLPAGFAGLVTAFQAFHWFAEAATVAEFARILRPGGRLAIVMNERDFDDPFTAAYGEAVDRFGQRSANVGYRSRMAIGGHEGGDEFIAALLEAGGFRNLRRRSFPYVQRLDREGLLGRLRSSSYVPAEGAAFDEVVASLNAIYDRFAREGGVDLVHRTDVTTAERG